MNGRFSRLAVSLAWGLVFAVGAYPIMRTLEAVLSPGPDPAAIIWSAHAGYFWRAGTVSYAGGMVAITAYPLTRRRVEAAARALVPGIAVATALLALGTAFFP